MRTLRILTFVLISLFVVSNSIEAQSWKDLKNKVKKTKSSLTKKKEDKTQTKELNANNNASNSNQTSNSANNETTQNAKPDDEEFNKYLEEKYNFIYSNDECISMSKINYSLQPDLHIKGIKKLDYWNTVKKLEEKGKPSNYKAGKMYDIILNYKDEYKKKYDEKLKAYINKQIEEAWRLKSNEGKSIECISNAKNMIDAATIILPGDEDVKKLKTDVDNSFESIAGPYFKKVYTSDFHKENAGKVVFSNKPIVIGEEDPAQFKTEFSINENIYAVAYLNGTIDALFEGNKSGKYEIGFQGEYPEAIGFSHNPEDLKLSYYPIEILPAANQAVHGIDAPEFAKKLSKLSPRTHEITIAFSGGYKQPQAIGKLTLNCAGIDAEKIMANANLAAKNASDNYAKNTKLPKSFADATTPFKDAGLSYTNMKNLLKTEWGNCATILKIGAYGTAQEDWLIYKNYLGIPTYKASYREIKAIYKGKDGWCYFVEGIVFRRDYAGGGKYTNVKFSTDGRHVKIDCKNVK